jgi:putative acetyltransferase
MAKIPIIRPFDPASPRDCLAWREVNLEWLQGRDLPPEEAQNYLEPRDMEILDNPAATVLAHGGCIWVAEASDSGAILGTIGLMVHDGHWEVIKLGVRASERGRGLGRALLETLIAHARAQGDIDRLVLDTASGLRPALRLYESLGFTRLSRPTGNFATADVAMELRFS